MWVNRYIKVGWVVNKASLGENRGAYKVLA